MELLQGDAGVQFAALEVGWDEVTDGRLIDKTFASSSFGLLL